jgi:adenylosuccinate lyase
MSREHAYEVVQRHALAAWDREVPLRSLLEADPEVAAVLDGDELDRVFDLESLLVHVDEIFDRTLQRPEVAAHA